MFIEWFEKHSTHLFDRLGDRIVEAIDRLGETILSGLTPLQQAVQNVVNGEGTLAALIGVAITDITTAVADLQDSGNIPAAVTALNAVTSGMATAQGALQTADTALEAAEGSAGSGGSSSAAKPA